MARTPTTKTGAKTALGEPDDELPIQQDVVINSGDPDRKWYVIHTYSGYENKVKTNLEHRISTMDVRDKIFQVVIPMEGEVEVKDGQRRTVQRKVFPGYVLVDMRLDDQSWYVVRNTPGVTGLVGSALGQHGINIMQFVKEYNEKTASQAGSIVPVEITVFEDRSFTFITKTPPAADLLRKAAGVERGSGTPNKENVGTISKDKLR